MHEGTILVLNPLLRNNVVTVSIRNSQTVYTLLYNKSYAFYLTLT